jgi:hypothetical protein
MISRWIMILGVYVTITFEDPPTEVGSVIQSVPNTYGALLVGRLLA